MSGLCEFCQDREYKEIRLFLFEKETDVPHSENAKGTETDASMLFELPSLERIQGAD